MAAGFVVTSASNVFSNGFHVYQAEIFPRACARPRSGRPTR